MSQNNPESGNNRVKSELLRWILICCGCISIVAGAKIYLLTLPTSPEEKHQRNNVTR